MRTKGSPHERPAVRVLRFPTAASPFIHHRIARIFIFPHNEAIRFLKLMNLPFWGERESHQVIENAGTYMLKAKR